MRPAVAIAGASGVLGRHVVARLRERGYAVKALVRSARARAFAEQTGAEAIDGDLFEPQSLEPLVRGAGVVINLATSIPNPLDRAGPVDWSANDRVREQGTDNLLAACRGQAPRLFIQQSVAFLHRSGPDWADEDSPVQPIPLTASAERAEAMARASGLPWCIVRGGAFYGAASGRDLAWREAVRASRLRLPGDGKGYVSLIHVADMAEAVVCCVERAEAGSLFNVVDDRPVTWRELLGHIAALDDAPMPEPGGDALLPSFRVRNLRARQALRWQPFFPSYLSGLRDTGREWW